MSDVLPAQEPMKTCLHDLHVALGAKMSPFAGFDMPIQYDSITSEHLAVRNEAGVFDVSHMGEIVVEGEDAADLVNYVFTNDIATMEPGKILYGMMCLPTGGVVDDLLVYKEFTPDRFFLVVNAANIAKDFAHIQSVIASGRSDGRKWNCVARDESHLWGQIALQGPKAEKVMLEVLGIPEAESLTFYTFCDIVRDGVRMIVSRTGYTGEDGFEIYTTPAKTRELWQALMEAGVTPCGLGCRDTLRFEAGLPLYGDELSEEISPVMAGFGMFCRYEKDFIGKEALLAQKTGGVAKKLVGIEIADKAIPRAGYPVLSDDGKEVGVVTTGYHSISLDKSICFALVDSAYAALGTSLSIQIRRKVFPGIVVKKRFYTTNYKK